MGVVLEKNIGFQNNSITFMGFINDHNQTGMEGIYCLIIDSSIRTNNNCANIGHVQYLIHIIFEFKMVNE